MTSLAESGDINLAATWAAVSRLSANPNARIGDIQLFVTGVPIAFFNGAVAHVPNPDPDEVIEAVMSFMEHQGVPWQLRVRRGVDDALLVAGRARNLREVQGAPSMGLMPVVSNLLTPSDIDIRVVSDEAGLEAHRDLSSQAFDLPRPFVDRLVPGSLLSEPGIAILVGTLDETPVSTSLLSVTETTAGIYNVATPVAFQRRGYGAALTWAAVEEGVRRGCDRATLQASSAGRPVYERMGFVHLGDYDMLEGPPNA